MAAKGSGREPHDGRLKRWEGVSGKTVIAMGSRNLFGAIEYAIFLQLVCSHLAQSLIAILSMCQQLD